MASRAKWLLCILTCLVALLTTATFAHAVDQTPDNGCTSPQPYAGAITTPLFTADPGSVITFEGWFEVESVSSSIDAISVEWSTPANPGVWNLLDDLRSQSATPSASGPTTPYSNNGTGVAPSFQSYSFDLGAALVVAQGVQVRINFNTQDSQYQGYRGVGIDNFAVSLTSPVISTDFEIGQPPGWTFDPESGPGGPFWQVLQNPQNVSVKSPEINPQLVTFPDAGAPLPAPQGAGNTRYAWFGRVDSGTFCGPDFANRFTLPGADTFLTSGPPASTVDKNATFSFSGTGAAGFQCQLDGGAFASCASPQSYTGLANGTHTFAVRGIDFNGNPDPTPAAQTWTIREATLADLPNPQYGVAVNVDQVSGTVRVGIRAAAANSGGSARASQKGITFVPLSEARQIPVGSFLDTRKGTVRLQSAANRAGKRQTGTFLQSLFQVHQSRKRSARGLTDLVLKGASFRRCRASRSKGASAALSAATIRRLRARARGRFRTSGRNSSATVRGTIWDVTDRCDGTLTKVRRGRVVVRDFRRKRSIVLTQGKSYLARAPR